MEQSKNIGQSPEPEFFSFRAVCPTPAVVWYPVEIYREGTMANVSKISSPFHCQRCGLGDFEVGHLTRPDEPFCLVCREEDGQLVRLERWEPASPIRPVSGVLCSPAEAVPFSAAVP
jgi:hypothetical protein